MVISGVVPFRSRHVQHCSMEKRYTDHLMQQQQHVHGSRSWKMRMFRTDTVAGDSAPLDRQVAGIGVTVWGHVFIANDHLAWLGRVEGRPHRDTRQRLSIQASRSCRQEKV